MQATRRNGGRITTMQRNNSPFRFAETLGVGPIKRLRRSPTSNAPPWPFAEMPSRLRGFAVVPARLAMLHDDVVRRRSDVVEARDAPTRNSGGVLSVGVARLTSVAAASTCRRVSNRLSTSSRTAPAERRRRRLSSPRDRKASLAALSSCR